MFVFLLVIFLSFVIDLWWFIVVVFFEDIFLKCLGEVSEQDNGNIKTLVEINYMNKSLPPNLDSPLQYNFTHYNISFTKVNGQWILHLLTFAMLHCSWWSPLAYLSDVLPCFPSTYVHDLLPEKYRFLLFSKSYPSVQWMNMSNKSASWNDKLNLEV